MTHNKLLSAVRYALYTGVASAVFVGAPAVAQGSDEAASEKLETVVVTGSRIRKVDIETEAPVLTISRADIEKTGFQSVADILQNVTAMGAPPISRASPLSAGENAGGTFISMRNLGAQRTLVLLNGKRLGISTSGLSDISTIPAVAVERIEVLKDGASAIYGSDAIAGVVNIITRTNYNGAAASAYYGQYDEDDGAITKADFVLGFGGERGSVTVAAEWTKEDAVFARDRPYSAYPQSNLHPDRSWTAAGQYGGFVPCARGTAPVAPSCFIPGVAAGRYILRAGGDPYNRADYRLQNVNSESPLDKSNTNLQTDLRTPLEQKNLYVDGVYNITEDIRFRTNLMYSNRFSARTVAGYPMQNASFPQTAPGMSVNSYYNPYGSWHTPEGGTPQGIPSWWRRSWEVPRVSDSQLDTYRFSGAFEGSFEIGDRYFDWDVSYLHNENRLLQKTFGNWNLSRTQAAVGPSFLNAAGRVQCGTPNAPIGFDVCVPFNPFLEFGRAGDGSLGNEDVQNFLFQTEHNSARTKTVVYAANLAGTAFTLPAGDLGFAVGYEYRKESGAFIPDALAATAGSSNLASNPTSGGYNVDEVYLELQVPILADLPFAQEFSVNAATRYSDYDTFGDTLNSKAGFRWKPIESLLFRGTWAEGFRAPTIADLYGGGSQTFSFYTDPCDTVFGASRDPNSVTRTRCRAELGNAIADNLRQLQQGFVPSTSAAPQTPVAFFSSAGNPLLEPEYSTSKTLGFVYSPSFVEGLNIGLDWWQIEIENTIVADAPGGILNDCYTQGIASRCVGFTRDPVAGWVNSFNFGNRNAGYREIEGFDLDVSYRLPTDSWGNFMFSWQTTYTGRDEFVTSIPAVGQPPFSNPTQNVSLGSAFRIRSNLNIGWDLGAFGVSWNARYFSAMKETCLNATQFPEECSEPGLYVPNLVGAPTLTNRNVSGSTIFHDVQLRWNAPWDATISFGANNVFEKVGPIMYSQPSANVSYYGGFDIGRFWYARYTQRF